MPPKRPRIIPSQTDLSVQDVRDYSTPDGSSMANEEMRRLKLALQQIKDVQEEQAQSIIAATGGSGLQAGEGGDTTVLPEVSYSFFVKAENYRAAEVKDKETVIFRGVRGINVSNVGKTITIAMPEIFWTLRADTGLYTVRNTNTLRITGINGVSTSVDSSTGSLIVNRPLTIYQRGIAIGDAGTIGVDFFNETNYKPDTYVQPIYFDVKDIGAGSRRVRAWSVTGGGGSYHWHASDGQHTHQVNSGGTVIWQGTNGVVVTLVPGQHTFTIDRPLQIQQDDTNIGGEDTTRLNIDNATVQKPLGHNSRIWTQVLDDGNGKRTLRMYYDPSGTTTTSLQIQQRSIDIGGNDTGILNFDNDVTVKPQNYTGRVYAQVIDDQNGKRSVRLWHTPGDITQYKWRIAALATPGEADVNNNDLVTFTGVSGINVVRTGGGTIPDENIIISVDSEKWGGGGSNAVFVITGILDFENSNNHYVWQDYNPLATPTLATKPPYIYGYRKYVDIAHGWNLNNMNNIEVHLLDISLEKDTETYLAYYRDGATTMSGEVIPTPPLSGRYAGKSIQRFRNFPFWTALNKDTVRFFASMSRNKPTHMKFRYSIRKL